MHFVMRMRTMKPWRRRMVLIVFAGSVLAAGYRAHAQQAKPAAPPGRDPITPRIIEDGIDAAPRRTDSEAGQIPWGVCLPDLLVVRMGPWAPFDPLVDLYDGTYDEGGIFACVELVFDGVVNPPGPTTTSFDPTLYGLCPIYGFVELDIDDNVDTGGEMEAPVFRYNANVARYAGMPVGPEFINRIGTDGQESDLVYDSPPWIDRSGEDFHLVLSNEEIVSILEVEGDQDGVFDAGETWLLEGHFFHRAHGYDIFTYGGGYEPSVELRFAHDPPTNTTTITLVYPLTNEAYAQATGTQPEGEDFDDSNANSIHEALWNLQFSATYPVLPGHEYEPLILPWASQYPNDYMDPRDWRPTFLLSTVLTEWTYGGLYMCVDTWPNVVAGDFNGDGLAGNTDAQMAADFLAAHDGDPLYDSDGQINGEIHLVGFGARFSIFDVNYDGVIDAYDVTYSQQAPGDYDNNGQIDLEDFAAFQRCYEAEQLDPGDLMRIGCMDAFDLDADEDVDTTDFALWLPLMSGP